MNEAQTDRLDRLRRANDILVHATTPEDLDRAHALMSNIVRRQRKIQQEESGTLAKSFIAAMEIWDAQKRDGVPEADRIDGLMKTLRSAWPETHHWTYSCERCLDTGLVIKHCDAGHRCNGISTETPLGSKEYPGRKARACRMMSDREHEYGEPCYCVKGARFVIQRPLTPADDEQAAAKSRKMTRLGKL